MKGELYLIGTKLLLKYLLYPSLHFCITACSSKCTIGYNVMNFKAKKRKKVGEKVQLYLKTLRTIEVFAYACISLSLFTSCQHLKETEASESDYHYKNTFNTHLCCF